ncbi:UNVERIFIED_CONTAM: hypothetical protein K2H54_024133 [Gekko kuhli]
MRTATERKDVTPQSCVARIATQPHLPVDGKQNIPLATCEGLQGNFLRVLQNIHIRYHSRYHIQYHSRYHSQYHSRYHSRNHTMFYNRPLLGGERNLKDTSG